MLRILFIGAGAIASDVLARLAAHGHAVQVTGVVRSSAAAAEPAVAPRWHGVPVLAALPARDDCDLVIEMAGARAVAAHVLPALRRGIPCFVCSVGALADERLAADLHAAAREGGTTLRLMSGAIGGLDALAAAAVAGLDRVRYTGRKPPQAWEGTPAETRWRLDQLTAPVVIFEGTAREAALAFPKNANVCATVALAGIGLDRTEVTLVADPSVDRNVHRIAADGAFGELAFEVQAVPSPANPRTSALTALSVVRAVLDHAGTLRF